MKNLFNYKDKAQTVSANEDKTVIKLKDEKKINNLNPINSTKEL